VTDRTPSPTPVTPLALFECSFSRVVDAGSPCACAPSPAVVASLPLLVPKVEPAPPRNPAIIGPFSRPAPLLRRAYARHGMMATARAVVRARRRRAASAARGAGAGAGAGAGTSAPSIFIAPTPRAPARAPSVNTAPTVRGPGSGGWSSNRVLRDLMAGEEQRVLQAAQSGPMAFGAPGAFPAAPSRAPGITTLATVPNQARSPHGSFSAVQRARGPAEPRAGNRASSALVVVAPVRDVAAARAARLLQARVVLMTVFARHESRRLETITRVYGQAAAKVEAEKVRGVRARAGDASSKCVHCWVAI
jgi:hypothetical protein